MGLRKGGKTRRNMKKTKQKIKTPAKRAEDILQLIKSRQVKNNVKRSMTQEQKDVASGKVMLYRMEFTHEGHTVVVQKHIDVDWDKRSDLLMEIEAREQMEMLTKDVSGWQFKTSTLTHMGRTYVEQKTEH